MTDAECREILQAIARVATSRLLNHVFTYGERLPVESWTDCRCGPKTFMRPCPTQGKGTPGIYHYSEEEFPEWFFKRL